MNKMVWIFLVVIVGLSLSACGDNKTKEKLLGSEVLTSTSGGATSAVTEENLAVTAITKTANMAAQAGALGTGSGIPTAQQIFSTVKNAGGLLPQDSDGDGWREYPLPGIDIKIQLLDAGNTLLTDAAILSGTSIKKIKAKITSTYSYGIWRGEFEIVRASDGSETMSGTITSDDPVGTTFTETLTNVTMDQTTISGIPICLPKSGTATLTSTGDYTGAFTFTHPSADAYKHQGTVTAEGKVVATVDLTFNKTFGNYTGYYIDEDGVRHEIN